MSGNKSATILRRIRYCRIPFFVLRGGGQKKKASQPGRISWSPVSPPLLARREDVAKRSSSVALVQQMARIVHWRCLPGFCTYRRADSGKLVAADKELGHGRMKLLRAFTNCRGEPHDAETVREPSIGKTRKCHARKRVLCLWTRSADQHQGQRPKVAAFKRPDT